MEAASISETSVYFYQAARRENPEDSRLQSAYNFLTFIYTSIRFENRSGGLWCHDKPVSSI
jgi:hypothetical protein